MIGERCELPGTGRETGEQPGVLGEIALERADTIHAQTTNPSTSTISGSPGGSSVMNAVLATRPLSACTV